MNISFKVLFIVFLIFFVSRISATIINIPADQPTIQTGIEVAVDGDTVLVQPGTYFENIIYNGKLITVASLFLTTQDTTFISQTIIDGNQSGSVVSFTNNEDPIAVLIGFTIQNGYANGWPYICGGGIYCHNSSPTLCHMVVINNMASGGGGIFCDYNSNPSLSHITITNNLANTYGGGIGCDESSPSLSYVTIAGNIANSRGGGISCMYQANPSLINTTISGNWAYDGGGGIFCWQDSNPTLVNTILWNDLPQEIYFNEYYSPNSVSIAYSDIAGGESGIVTNNNGVVYWLEGNIDADPLFVDPENGDYHLSWDNYPIPDSTKSPCIDTGDPNSPLDPDGTIADMGAFYFDQNQQGVEDISILKLSNILYQNYPNPFKPSNAGRSPATTISFQLPENGEVNLSIYNIKGQKIKTIVNEKLEQGLHQIIWDGKNDNNQYVASGVYFYKLKVNNKNIAIKKCLLLK